MRYCAKCGLQLPDTAKFCKSCGQPLAAPAAPSPPVVGAMLSCSACDTANREGAKFCRNCGRPLAAEAAPATPAEVPRTAARPAVAAVPAPAARPAPAPARAPFSAPLEPETDWRRWGLIAGAGVLVAALAAAGWYYWTNRSPAVSVPDDTAAQPPPPKTPAISPTTSVLSQVPGCSISGSTTYTVVAKPLGYVVSGDRSFCTDESGVTRFATTPDKACDRNSFADPEGRSPNEASAIGSLRTLNTAAVTYQYTYGNGYPPSLAALGPPASESPPNCDRAGLIDNILASGTKAGYAYIYTPGTPISSSQAASASPTEPLEGTPQPDQSGRIRELLANAEANFQQADYCRARRYCDEALRLDPRHSQARTLRNKIQQTIDVLGTQCGGE